MRFLLSLSFLFYVIAVFGNSISGVIIDNQKNPIEFANIILHKYSDAAYLNGTTTDSLGKFEITNIKAENYFLEIIYVGYKIDTLKN